MSDRWTDRLSEYVDGELSAAERAELEAHLAGCQDCATTLEQLRQVVARAHALEDQPPGSDLWAGIAARIGAARDAVVADLEEHRRRRRGPLGARRFTLSLPQLAAASVALVILSGGSAWLLSRAENPEVGAVEPAAGGALLPVSAPAAGFGVAGYDAAIAELEDVIQENRDRLDTATVRIIEENLMIIDRAIAQAQRALVQDPASIYLNEYLAATMRQKLEFLRQAAQMTSAAS
ncbi:MAG: zf-HC2 domain-containing protein [Gemmatimonadota bacterium]|nr:MAG: zf-HC2 domain-containing protein [Gemmatimonadota bacterium]